MKIVQNFDKIKTKIKEKKKNKNWSQRKQPHFEKAEVDSKIQTLKRFKRTLFIKTKHNLQIFRGILFVKLQNDT